MQVGTHGAGPNWTSTVDGSVVNGAKIAQENAPLSGAIPWLLLKAASTTGTGVFSDVTYVQRLATVGGVAPAGGCDATTAGTDTRVGYSADYTSSRVAPPVRGAPAAPGAPGAAERAGGRLNGLEQPDRSCVSGAVTGPRRRFAFAGELWCSPEARARGILSAHDDPSPSDTARGYGADGRGSLFRNPSASTYQRRVAPRRGGWASGWPMRPSPVYASPLSRTLETADHRRRAAHAGPYLPRWLAGDQPRALGGAHPARGGIALSGRVRGLGVRTLSPSPPGAASRVWRCWPRALPVIREIVVSHVGQNIHGGVPQGDPALAALQPARLRRPRLPRSSRISRPPASTSLDFKDPVRARLMLFNDISHYQAQPRRSEGNLSKWWDPAR